MSDFQQVSTILDLAAETTARSVADSVLSAQITALQPIRINTNTTWYVAFTGSDTTGDGTALNPYQSLQKVADLSQQIQIRQGAVLTIKVGAGTWGTEANTALTTLYFEHLGDMYIEPDTGGGLTATQLYYTMVCTSASGQLYIGGVGIGRLWSRNGQVFLGTASFPSLRCLSLTNATSIGSASIFSAYNGGAIRFSATPLALTIEAATYTNGKMFDLFNSGGLYGFGTVINLTVTGTLALGSNGYNGFFYMGSGSSANWNMTLNLISGTITGARFTLRGPSNCAVPSASTTFFPGSIAGTAYAPSSYNSSTW